MILRFLIPVYSSDNISNYKQNDRDFRSVPQSKETERNGIKAKIWEIQFRSNLKEKVWDLWAALLAAIVVRRDSENQLHSNTTFRIKIDSKNHSLQNEPTDLFDEVGPFAWCL